MKKLIALALALILALSLVACGQEEAPAATDAPNATDAPVVTDAPIVTTNKPEETKAPDGKITYTVKIQDEAGNPIAGAKVQICSQLCIPTKADAQGVATWTVAKDTYKISFLPGLEGYVLEEAYYFEGDATEMTIILKAAA